MTAQDLATHANYRVTVNRAPSSDATLSALGLSSGVLTPGFQPGVLNYTADVTNATDTITVTPTATDPNATIMVNGNHVDSGTASQAFPLAVGENTISIEVTAADTTTSTTYVLKVTRAPSSDAALANLTVSTGLLDQKFKPTLLKYTESVIHTVDTITVTPTADDPAATITVNGTAVASGTASQAIPLVVGDTLISILVTAPDGVTKTTYTITVTRAPSSVATLSKLTLSSGYLVPAFQPTRLVYAAGVTNDIASITVTPTATDPTATITVKAAGTEEAVASGTTSSPIPLTVGVINTITIVVTAQDGSTTTTYRLDVIRYSADATLSDLALFVGGVAVPPNPIFDPNTFNYTASAASSDTEMTVTVTPSSPYYSSITVNGVRVKPGTASQPITLVAGDTPINVVVTAQDGVSTQTYTITVTRPASTDASLSGLSLSSGIAVPINPQFDPATPNYTAKVQYDTLFVKVTPTATDDRATIDVEGQAVVSGDESGEISLSNGVTPINVVVTAEDGTTTETYLIEVLRPWDTVPETLKATLVDPGALFGWSVAIDGDTMVIGAPEDSTAKLSDPQYDNTGAAYVFTRDPGTGDWVQSHVLRPGNLQNGARYGVSVAIQGDRIVVGADSFDLAAGFENGGLAYVFSRTNTTDWQQTGVLASPGSVKNGKFGTSVSIDIDRIVVGALGEESGKGAAHVWAFNSATNLWQHEQTLTASDGATGDTFGAAVVIDESKIAVGAAFHAAGGTRRGAVYVYEPINLVWTETDKLVASNAGDEDWFGASVALDEDTLVAGAPNEDSITEPNSGAVYVFRRDPTNRAWSETQILRGDFFDGAFGSSVAMDNGNMVIGEPGNTPIFIGRAHFFTSTISGWRAVQNINSPNPNTKFGFAVDIDGDTIVVGQPREDTNGDDSGAAQVYE